MLDAETQADDDAEEYIEADEEEDEEEENQEQEMEYEDDEVPIALSCLLPACHQCLRTSDASATALMLLGHAWPHGFSLSPQWASNLQYGDPTTVYIQQVQSGCSHTRLGSSAKYPFNHYEMHLLAAT